MTNRMAAAGAVAALAVLQAWDSGVYRAGTTVAVLVLLAFIPFLLERVQWQKGRA